MGAGVVALGTSAALPDLKNVGGYASGDVLLARADLADRQKTVADRASRTEQRGAPMTTINQGAPDLWQLPVRGYVVSSGFGFRWGRLHGGVDLAAPQGTPIYAAAAGTVILARPNGGFGNNVQIQHPDGVISIYGHMSRIIAREGQHVEAGQLIGLVGNTGFSFGNHLHFEIHVNDLPTEPMAFMRAHGVDVGKHIEVVSGGELD